MTLLHHLVSAAAERDPTAVAVRDQGRDVSYGELETRANRLAWLLRDAGVERGDRVALYHSKTADAVVALYAILKAGACYVPLDPGAPASRSSYIVRDCAVKALVTQSSRAEALTSLLDGSQVEAVVVTDGDVPPRAGVQTYPSAAIDSHPATPPGGAGAGADLAYILYTSGSTGSPKGVMLSHRNALAFVDWVVQTYEVGATDRLSSHAPFHFDLSVLDLYAASSAGAAVVLVPATGAGLPREVTEFIRREEISIWYSVPSILVMMLLRGGVAERDFPSLRTLLFAGEVFQTKYLRTLMARLPHVRFANLYGPTETNVCTAYEVVEPEDGDDRPIPIGRPIDGVTCMVVDEDGRRVPGGEVGELYVHGDTVMQGYWGDEARTAERLVRNPLDSAQEGWWYRTGDLVREAPSGDLEFFGRRDHQIKSRGYRIELGEIEVALAAHPAVEHVAAVAIPDDLITNVIHAVITVSEEVAPATLLRHCAERLPAYMVPSGITVLPSMPLTSTGKLDRQALTRIVAQERAPA